MNARDARLARDQPAVGELVEQIVLVLVLLGLPAAAAVVVAQTERVVVVLDQHLRPLQEALRPRSIAVGTLAAGPPAPAGRSRGLGVRVESFGDLRDRRLHRVVAVRNRIASFERQERHHEVVFELDALPLPLRQMGDARNAGVQAGLGVADCVPFAVVLERIRALDDGHVVMGFRPGDLGVMFGGEDVAVSVRMDAAVGDAFDHDPVARSEMQPRHRARRYRRRRRDLAETRHRISPAGARRGRSARSSRASEGAACRRRSPEPRRGSRSR